MAKVESVKMGRPALRANEKKRYTQTVRVDEDIDKLVTKVAKSQGVSKSEIYRIAVEFYCNHIDEIEAIKK